MYATSDDANLILPTDIEAYVVQPDKSVEGFRILVEAFSAETNHLKIEPGCFDELESRSDRREYLFENEEKIAASYLLANDALNKLSLLNSFDRIGDPTTSFSDEIIPIEAITNLVLTVVLYTELSYANGNDRRSIDDLLLLNDIFRRWIPYTQTFLHSTAGVYVLGKIRDSLNAILPYLQADELEAVLEGYSQPLLYTRIAERSFYSEYYLFADGLDQVIAESKRGLYRSNIARNKTLNIYAAHLEEQIALARRLEWDKMKEGDAEFRAKANGFHFFNRDGWELLSLVMLNVGLLFENAYSAEAKDALFAGTIRERLELIRSESVDINVRNLPTGVDSLVK